MENQSNLKTELRASLIAIRKSIPLKRRQEASELLFRELKNRGHTLSFTTIGSEIDVSSLNAYLKEQGRLFLVPYKVESLIKAPIDKIDCILVPGLGFDKNKNRIGYGKGYYDQFLAKVKDVPTIGVGFKEQLCVDPLPTDPWDVPLSELILV